jgi:hypothetical protein
VSEVARDGKAGDEKTFDGRPATRGPGGRDVCDDNYVLYIGEMSK